MIGTLIIAVVGYGMAALNLAGALVLATSCFVAADLERTPYRATLAALLLVIALALAALTRWLTGGVW